VLKLSITIQTPITAGTGLQIKFPKLNPDAPTSQQKSMVKSDVKATRTPSSPVKEDSGLQLVF
jgi:hypothetical protein